MDPVSVRMARTALLWLVLGFILGGLMLSDRLVPGTWRLWFSPTHGHILFVGWFLQFAVGVAYWLLPRKRSPERPFGYREEAALTAYLLLNAGLALRVVAEPLQRDGNDAALLDWLLAASSLLQIAAVAIIASQLWRRIVPRRASQRPE
jgi:hypothetical protein